jgi:hypothetical protein
MEVPRAAPVPHGIPLTSRRPFSFHILQRLQRLLPESDRPGLLLPLSQAPPFSPLNPVKIKVDEVATFCVVPFLSLFFFLKNEKKMQGILHLCDKLQKIS